MMVFTTEQVANRLDLSRKTVQKYCTRYKIGQKLGRDWFLGPKDIEVIRAHMREDPIAPLGSDNDIGGIDEHA